jgi:hypothetical protein
MDIPSPDPPYFEIVQHLTQGKLVIFLGPLANRLPEDKWQPGSHWSATDTELAQELARPFKRSAELPFEINHPLHLLEVASYIQDMYGRYKLIDELRNILNVNYKPHGLYAYLASIPTPLFIVSTNYDDLLEQAFDKAHHPFQRISPVSDFDSVRRSPYTGANDLVVRWRPGVWEPEVVPLHSLNIDPRQSTVIIKLRGTVDNQRRFDSFIITEDDYLNFLTRLTNQTDLLRVFSPFWKESAYLFWGYGLPSFNLRVLLKSLMRSWRLDRDSRRRAWIFESNPTRFGIEFWRSQSAEIYKGIRNEFVNDLASEERRVVKDTLTQMKSKTGVKSPTVFISYAKEDAAQAKGVYKALKANGFNPWRDKEKILPGEEWDPKIKRSLKQSDFLLVCLSNISVEKRGYIQREIRIALDLAQEFPPSSIFLIPVRFDECEVPDELARYQYFDWYSADGPDDLIRAIAIGWHRRNKTARPSSS